MREYYFDLFSSFKNSTQIFENFRSDFFPLV